ncbi:SDR family oxidoreductase [Streptomyces sp. NPDC050636]|uniref:SDR family NAD(P)-dependent oxidoreductase n=1 Tax=Streptomyces sp. NPDC050636 TaxID=3154510 RepID=UPI0034429AD9
MITGASSGIGAAAARLFGAEGASLVLMARRQKLLQDLVEEVCEAGGAATAVAGDVTSVQDVTAAVAAAREVYGGLNGAFNNAGWSAMPAPLHLMDDSDFDATMNVNVRGVWNCLRQQIPALLENPDGGSIVNTSSTAGVVSPRFPPAPYIAAKHAVIGLTKAAAEEYGDRNIRVNALIVGATRTELMQQGFDLVPTLEQDFKDRSMLPRVAEPDEIAQAAAWLCSDASSFVTGGSIPVDGGFTAL